MISPASTAATLWVVWLLGWLLSAGATAKTVAIQSAPARLTHSAFISAGAVLVFFHPSFLGSLRQPFRYPIWISWTGIGLVAIGLAFAAWARFHLGRLWSGHVTLKEDHTIVRTGPYAIVRHPIYTGLVLGVIGTVVSRITPAALIGALLFVAGVLIKIRQEEQLLTDHFGAGYDAYRADVHALIPYVW